MDLSGDCYLTVINDSRTKVKIRVYYGSGKVVKRSVYKSKEWGKRKIPIGYKNVEVTDERGFKVLTITPTDLGYNKIIRSNPLCGVDWVMCDPVNQNVVIGLK